mmetsp:Transcript_12474/g.49940  ORF Transcript_12474/g.49940 Transcript_12474/m.49940 type:complete len:644 (-) Transcript_12474:271-2202(-)
MHANAGQLAAVDGHHVRLEELLPVEDDVVLEHKQPSPVRVRQAGPLGDGPKLLNERLGSRDCLGNGRVALAHQGDGRPASRGRSRLSSARRECRRYWVEGLRRGVRRRSVDVRLFRTGDTCVLASDANVGNSLFDRSEGILALLVRLEALQLIFSVRELGGVIGTTLGVCEKIARNEVLDSRQGLPARAQDGLVTEAHEMLEREAVGQNAGLQFVELQRKRSVFLEEVGQCVHVHAAEDRRVPLRRVCDDGGLGHAHARRLKESELPHELSLLHGRQDLCLAGDHVLLLHLDAPGLDVVNARVLRSLLDHDIPGPVRLLREADLEDRHVLLGQQVQAHGHGEGRGTLHHFAVVEPEGAHGRLQVVVPEPHVVGRGLEGVQHIGLLLGVRVLVNRPHFCESNVVPIPGDLAVLEVCLPENARALATNNFVVEEDEEARLQVAAWLGPPADWAASDNLTVLQAELGALLRAHTVQLLQELRLVVCLLLGDLERLCELLHPCGSLLEVLVVGMVSIGVLEEVSDQKRVARNPLDRLDQEAAERVVAAVGARLLGQAELCEGLRQASREHLQPAAVVLHVLRVCGYELRQVEKAEEQAADQRLVAVVLWVANYLQLLQDVCGYACNIPDVGEDVVDGSLRENSRVVR